VKAIRTSQSLDTEEMALYHEPPPVDIKHVSEVFVRVSTRYAQSDFEMENRRQKLLLPQERESVEEKKARTDHLLFAKFVVMETRSNGCVPSVPRLITCSTCTSSQNSNWISYHDSLKYRHKWMMPGVLTRNRTNKHKHLSVTLGLASKQLDIFLTL
jgi:hypothetical protein